MIQKFLGIVIVALLGWALGIHSPARAEPIQDDTGLSESSEGTAKNDTADAVTLFRNGDYDGSLKLWKEAAKKNPDMPPAQTIMAQLFLGSNKLQDAIRALEQAGVDAPYDPESYAILAGIELNRADLSKAESLLEKAKELMSKGQLSDRRKPGLQRQIDFGFATLAEVRKDWPSAQKVWEEILKINPKDTIATTRLAHCLFRQKDVDGALKVLREAAKSNPKMVAPEALIAQIYQQDGDVENMDKWMDAAVKANPKNVATRIAAGYAALTQGRLDDVRAHAVAAAQIDPKSYDSVVLRGLVSVFQKDFMAAELFFETALQQLPNSFPISNNLALALAEQDGKGKKERALEIAETNIKKYPRSPNAASTYGWVLYRLGRVDDAEKALRNAVNGSISVDTAYYVARVMVDQGHKDEAIKILQSVSNDKTSLSMYRQEAKELLESLKKK